MKHTLRDTKLPAGTTGDHLSSASGRFCGKVFRLSIQKIPWTNNQRHLASPFENTCPAFKEPSA
jgi:hypothetical protein